MEGVPNVVDLDKGLGAILARVIAVVPTARADRNAAPADAKMLATRIAEIVPPRLFAPRSENRYHHIQYADSYRNVDDCQHFLFPLPYRTCANGAKVRAIPAFTPSVHRSSVQVKHRRFRSSGSTAAVFGTEWPKKQSGFYIFLTSSPAIWRYNVVIPSPTSQRIEPRRTPL